MIVCCLTCLQMTLVNRNLSWSRVKHLRWIYLGCNLHRRRPRQVLGAFVSFDVGVRWIYLGSNLLRRRPCQLLVVVVPFDVDVVPVLKR